MGFASGYSSIHNSSTSLGYFLIMIAIGKDIDKLFEKWYYFDYHLIVPTINYLQITRLFASLPMLIGFYLLLVPFIC